MQILIDIPEERYKWIVNRVEESKNEPTHLPMEYELIANGTPLPKGHGRLIDADNINVIELEDSFHIIRHQMGDEVDWYIDAPIIIEAEMRVDAEG